MYPLKIVIVAGCKSYELGASYVLRIRRIRYSGLMKIWITLKRVPMEENFDCFDDSSGSGGNRPATNEHFDASNKA